MEYFLGLDLGGQSLKAALIDFNNNELFIVNEDYEEGLIPENNLERNIDVFWKASRNAIKRLINETKCDPKQIKALSFSITGETFVLTDENFIPVRKAIAGWDTRGEKEVEVINSEFGQSQMYEISGQPDVAVCWPSVKLLMIKNNEPETYKRAKRFLTVEDYLIYKLTGKYVTETTVISTSLFFDMRTDQWYKPMLDFLNIEERFLPEVKKPCEIVGNLSKEAALQTGLSSETVVVTGAMDQIAGAVGSGNIMPGIITETTGTSLALGITYQGDLKNLNSNIPICPHAVENSYFLLPWSPSGGLTLKWLKDEFFKEEIAEAQKIGEDPYNLLTKMAEEIAPGSEGLLILPFIIGIVCPENNPRAKGIFFGLGINHTKKHLARAVMESIGYTIRDIIDMLKESGILPQKIISLGGGAKSHLWNQIKADINKVEVITLKYGDISAAIGACILAAKGCGEFESFEQIANLETFIKIETYYTPNQNNFLIYDMGYEKYKELYKRVKDLF
ncbi:MAG: FGGY family carbohydrate kinase [Actinobacteria bacterium]|nr:FGGY family carbohydrate kinase [Actinomycetota bacterium]